MSSPFSPENHVPEYVEITTTSGNTRWRAYCTCGWYTLGHKSSAYWAQRSWQAHVERVRERRMAGATS